MVDCVAPAGYLAAGDAMTYGLRITKLLQKRGKEENIKYTLSAGEPV